MNCFDFKVVAPALHSRVIIQSPFLLKLQINWCLRKSFWFDRRLPHGSQLKNQNAHSSSLTINLTPSGFKIELVRFQISKHPTICIYTSESRFLHFLQLDTVLFQPPSNSNLNISSARWRFHPRPAAKYCENLDSRHVTQHALTIVFYPLSSVAFINIKALKLDGTIGINAYRRGR